MIVTVLQLIAVFGVPVLILRQREKGIVRTFGTIAMAYFWGIVVAVAAFLCRKAGLDVRLNADVGQIGSYVCIGLAIPLLMFGTNLADVRRLAKPVLISFALLLLAVSAVVVVLGRTLGAGFPWGQQLAAMAAGMYTGGSPNFNAIGVILGVPGDTIAIGNLSDMIVGTVFYIFILTLAKPLCAKVLDRHAKQGAYMRENGGVENVDALEWNGFHRGIVRNLALSLACVLVGAVIGFAIWKVKGGALTDPLVPAVMIAGTVLGLALSFVPKVRNVKENSAAGHSRFFVRACQLARSRDARRESAAHGRAARLHHRMLRAAASSALPHFPHRRGLRHRHDDGRAVRPGVYPGGHKAAALRRAHCAGSHLRRARLRRRHVPRRGALLDIIINYTDRRLSFSESRRSLCLAESAPAGANEVRLKTFLPAACASAKILIGSQACGRSECAAASRSLSNKPLHGVRVFDRFTPSFPRRTRPARSSQPVRPPLHAPAPAA